MQVMIHWYIHIFAVGILESPLKHALVCLSIYSVSIYVYEKSLPFAAGPASTHGSTPAAVAAASSSSSSVSSPLDAGFCLV